MQDKIPQHSPAAKTNNHAIQTHPYIHSMHPTYASYSDIVRADTPSYSISATPACEGHTSYSMSGSRDQTATFSLSLSWGSSHVQALHAYSATRRVAHTSPHIKGVCAWVCTTTWPAHVHVYACLPAICTTCIPPAHYMHTCSLKADVWEQVLTLCHHRGHALYPVIVRHDVQS